MKFKYVGPHDAVDLPGVGTVERGHQVEVTGAAAESLTKQTDWQRVAPPKKRAAKKAVSKKAVEKPVPTPPVTGDKNEE